MQKKYYSVFYVAGCQKHYLQKEKTEIYMYLSEILDQLQDRVVLFIYFFVVVSSLFPFLIFIIYFQRADQDKLKITL